MTIYQLECFIAVAEELNFSAAAERLFTTQPAITYQINALEKETGLHLFERTTRRTKLTAAGQSFYLDMVQMTSFGRQALKKAQDIQDADRSHLTVGLRQLFDYNTFSSILAQFQHQFPNACVDVVPQDNRRPLEQLRSGQLDIGFFYATEHSRDRDISFTPLFSLGYHVLMNPNSPLADRWALHLADLKGQSVVSSGAFDSFLSACQGPSLEQLAQVGVDCSKIDHGGAVPVGIHPYCGYEHHRPRGLQPHQQAADERAAVHRCGPRFDGRRRQGDDLRGAHPDHPQRGTGPR